MPSVAVGVRFTRPGFLTHNAHADEEIAANKTPEPGRHILLGSTAERVVRHAPCAVLVVREHEQEFA